jgi:hypothetical protein
MNQELSNPVAAAAVVAGVVVVEVAAVAVVMVVINWYQKLKRYVVAMPKCTETSAH